MSTFRGWSDALITRVTRAGSHYLEPDSLRWHGSFGGRERRFHNADGTWYASAVVESVGSDSLCISRYWRVTVFTFIPSANGGEIVSIAHPADNLTRHQANKVLSAISG